MDGINEVQGKALEFTEKAAPFEIVIRTRDPQYIAQGGPVEMVIPCEGYFLSTREGDGQGFHAQGCVNQAAIVASVLKHIDSEAILAALVMGALDKGMQGDS